MVFTVAIVGCWLQLLKEDVTFDIYMPDEKTKVGAMTRKFYGWKQEILTDSQQYLLEVPKTMAANCKTLLLGATFLIEYMCYVSTNK